jgi:hypothetical protein
MRPFLLIALLSVATACASTGRPVPGEKLYFSVEMRHDGKVVGKPRLLGEAGKTLKVQKRLPGARTADYELTLAPSTDGEAYHLKLEVFTPAVNGRKDFELLHGEERKVELGDHPGDLEIRLLMMKVDSDEFRAFMREAGASTSRGASI